MDKIEYVVTSVSILIAARYWILSRRRWVQIQRLNRWMDNTLCEKNTEIAEAKMLVDNSRADVIRLYAIIEDKNQEIERLTQIKIFAAKRA